MATQLQVRKSPPFLATAIFALAASATLGGGLGYALKSPVAVPGQVRAAAAHSTSTDSSVGRDECVWANVHKSC